MTKIMHILSPELLPERPLLKHNDYTQRGEVTSLDGIDVTHSERAKTAHTYTSAGGDGLIADRLRQYATVLSRYSIGTKYAKKFEVPIPAVNATNRVFSNIMFAHAFRADPTVGGTLDVTQFANYLASQKQHSPDLLAKAFGLMYTDAWNRLIDTISQTNKPFAELLNTKGQSISEMLGNHSNMYNAPRYINSDIAFHRRDALHTYRWLARAIDKGVQDINEKERVTETKRATQHDKIVKNKDGSIRYRVVRLENDQLDGWERLRVAKPDLDINHTGKLGRRTIAVNTGKSPRYLNRIVTDPEKRIFSRKTRSLGGVVVIDNSGSMSLSQEELAKLMECSAGATVVMYSGGKNDYPNVWLIARKGRQIRHIPDVPGNNGIDGPALVWATQYRRRRSVPIIWVSDGQVTGEGDCVAESLVDQVNRIQKKYNIVRVSNVQRATQLMNKLQRRYQ